MALLQISEPGKTPIPHQKRVAIGIDLGTTNSLVATVRNGHADTLPDINGNRLLPSVVHYATNHDENVVITVGFAAKENGINDPENTVSSIKRLMGRKLSEIDTRIYPYSFSESENGLPLLNLPEIQGNAIQISSRILIALAERAKSTLGQNIDGAVITVPAYFDDAQRQATKDAAHLAGLPVLRLLNEPTAAAIAYGLGSKKEGIIAVYDLGGGTFDISILRLHKGVFEVLAAGGDTSLGGDDFDWLLINYIKKQLNITHNISPSFNQKIIDIAVSTKIALSHQQKADVVIDDKTLTITREEFNQLINPLVKRTLHSCRRAIKDAQITNSDIMDVVMVGGSTRIPLVRELVGDYFQKEPLTSIDPDQVVAIGAAIQADILIGNKPDSEMLLLDVIPLSLGVETMGELVEKIIPRNSTIPCTRAQEFTTFKDGQTAMMIHVLQGERENVASCRSLAKFTLSGIPPMPAGGAHIKVTFQVDADGLLSVTALEKSTGTESSIQVKPSYGLTDNEIAKMIKDSISYAQQDKLDRILAEKKVDAARILENLESALKKDAHLLDKQELHTILAEKQALQAAAESNVSESIDKQIKRLDSATQRFAEKRMNESIRQTLTGKRVDEI